MALGSFAAVALGAALAFPGFSAAGAVTVTHGGATTARHPVTRLAPRPHGNTARVLAGNLINHGGPVQTAPKIYVDFWGFSTDPSGERTYLTNFLKSIGGNAWLSTVNQYGASSTPVLAGTWNRKAAKVPAQPTDAAIQRQAVATASHFGAGNSDNVQIVVATPTGHNTSGFGTQFCAYHGAVSSDPNITYTNLPYITDAGASCGEDSVNGSAGTLDGVSIVEGHEMAETLTDPLLNAWFDSSGQEIGDKCAWINLQDITTSAGRFAVQPLWSNAAGGCVQ